MGRVGNRPAPQLAQRQDTPGCLRLLASPCSVSPIAPLRTDGGQAVDRKQLDKVSLKKVSLKLPHAIL